ncbi:MAG: hypothetical protein QG594_745 [Bacteroidota bacterium]|nr:hypothetical protein [Bacteroidota bacterium]
MLKDTSITFRISEDNKREIQKMAATEVKSVGQLIIDRILGKEDYVQGKEDYVQFLLKYTTDRGTTGYELVYAPTFALASEKLKEKHWVFGDLNIENCTTR